MDFDFESNDKDPKFKVEDLWRYENKNIFAKNHTPNCFKEVFVIKKNKNTIPSKYLMADLNGEKIIGEPHEQKFERQMNQSLRLKKIIRRKGTTDIK